MVEEPNHTTARKPGVYKLYDTLYTYLTLDSHNASSMQILRIDAGFYTVQCINNQQVADLSTLFTTRIVILQ
jgi:hypothetical protein